MIDFQPRADSAAPPADSSAEKPFLHFELAPERIAERPIYQTAAAACGLERCDSRLLLLNRKAGIVADRRFVELPGFILPEDLLLLNNTKVVPYRFFFAGPGGRRYELLLTERLAGEQELYRGLAKPLQRFRPGRIFNLGPRLRAEVKTVSTAAGEPWLTVLLSAAGLDRQAAPAVLQGIIADEGSVPIPPYIRRGVSDNLDHSAYQTVYSTHPGSVAAPTAGLHFTPQLLEQISASGTAVEFVTLHLGPASFQPIRGAVADHKMPVERFSLPLRTAAAIAAAKQRGGRIFAVGTSTVRTVESLGFGRIAAQAEQRLAQVSGSTDLFITPGFSFSVVDHLITNFHQPGSTHLLLVNAFAGADNTARAYHHALAGSYRFLSYGDSMLIL